MKRLWMLAVLFSRFFSDLLVAAFRTGITIIFDSDAPRRGFVRLSYGDLNESGAMLLGAMVSLTPGTSLCDIDTDKCELLLHLLDTDDSDATLRSIERRFLEPIRVVFGTAS
jgi:multisubunit Na+/H+ antiporter MnhE subunit